MEDTPGRVSKRDSQPQGEPTTPDSHTDPEPSCEELYQLGKSYRDRFSRFGKLEDLERAIECHSRALALTPNGHPDLSRQLGNLAISYVYRFERLGEIQDLERAIEYNSRAVELTFNDHPELPRWLANLGVSYHQRFRRLGDLQDLEQAIEYGSFAVATAPDDHADLARWLSNLGTFYTDRFQHLGEFEDLVKTMVHKSRAVELTPSGHRELPRRLANLGMSYTDLFRRLGRLEDIEKAIEYGSRAVSLTPNDHPDQSRQLSSLAVSYADRFQLVGEVGDLEKAIECGSRAATLLPEGHPDLSRRLTNLGVYHNDRFRHLGGLEDLVTAMEQKYRALELTPDGHPTMPFKQFQWAVSCFLRYQHTSDLAYLNKSLDAFRKASQQPTGAPRNKFQYALHWATLASKHTSLNCMEAYQTTIDLLPQFIWLGASTNQRYQDLLMAENLAVNAASVAILSSDYPLALEWLEHARCVVWNQRLMLSSPLDQLRNSHPDIAAQLQNVANQLHSASSETRASDALSSDLTSPEQVAQQRRRLAKEYQDLLTKARQLPGFENFLRPMRANDLTRAARNGPIIIINCHANRCDALLILPGQDDIGHLPLPSFTEQKAQHALSEMNKSLRQKRLRERGVKTLQEPGYKDRIEKVLSVLWDDIVKPVLDFLGYTVFGQAATPGHKPLPGTVKELAYVESHTQSKAQYSQLVDSQATTATVLDAMEQHEWVHLACHAHQNINNPTKSGFFLHDGTLDLAAINKRSFKNKGLAFLSACQTATGDEKLPDEAIHLASGMLMAGYPSVIATMWSVVDDDAPFVADKVYAELMKDGKVGNGEAGKALHYAVAALRDKIGEQEFGRWVPYIHIGS
ncbi:hypothetical protein OPQ81_000051 [Rhizoctonia solani]|nr:hypothetical protein OPQ81_000051 [Rhizoctonia solani]